jgi:hypothetical protein
MKTPLELATEHARAYVHNRGWRVEPLTWEEVRELMKAVYTPREIDVILNQGYDPGYGDGQAAGKKEVA